LYGGIPGTVTDISADTLAEEKGTPYYRVRIALSKNKINDSMPLFPGMTADVNILSGKITVWQYLMRPVWKVSQNALREAK
jgi:adhesin transport system membrane fusion protein